MTSMLSWKALRWHSAISDQIQDVNMLIFYSNDLDFYNDIKKNEILSKTAHSNFKYIGIEYLVWYWVLLMCKY